MDRFNYRTSVCGVCGNEQGVLYLIDSEFNGETDLDFRPYGSVRDSMCSWIQTCKKCGFVSYQLELGRIEDYALLQSREYKECEGVDFVSGLAPGYYQQGMIFLNRKQYFNAYLSFLQAAWVCDSEEDDTDVAARLCREKAACIFEKVKTKRTIS